MGVVLGFVVELVFSPYGWGFDAGGVATGDFGEGDSVDVAVDGALGFDVAFVSLGDFYACAGGALLEVVLEGGGVECMVHGVHGFFLSVGGLVGLRRVAITIHPLKL